MKKIRLLFILLFIILLIPISINLFVIHKTKTKIYSIDDINSSYEYALILGCSVHRDGTPSLMLKDRLDKGIELYNNKIVSEIIISGDHSDGYSEVDVMYKYLINNGVDSKNIIRDDKGYSTGDSISNYYNNYKDNEVIIITQKYHLYRALYIANYYNLKYIGVSAKEINYRGQFFRDIRELFARCKDFIKYY